MFIECQHVTKLYGTVIGLNDVWLELEPGAYGLLGPNGSGKSTFLNLLTGQLRPTIGSLRLFGEDPWNNREIRRRMGVCPEPDLPYDSLSGFSFVRYLLRLHGYSRSEADQRTCHALERAGMTHAMHRRIGTYSKGMRQRTKLAQALAHDADVLVLDEPFNGLDPIGRHEMVEMIRGLASQGKSVLMATHILHEVEAVTDRFILIYRGRVLASGDIAEIRELLVDIPHVVRIRCDQATALGRALLDGEVVEGVRLEEEGKLLSVTTRHPIELYRGLPEFVDKIGISVSEVRSPDESLQTLFDYLLKQHRPGGEA